MKAKNLILAGAGSSGREIMSWLATQKNDFEVKGFIDDIRTEPDVLATIKDYQPQPDDVFACTIGEPLLKMKVVAELENKGARFINLVHSSAVILSNIEEVQGLVIAPFVYVSCNVTLGRFVFANVAASIGHDALIGEGTTLSSHVDVTGYVQLGKRVFMGTHACVIPGKTIGDDAVIGAGSAVMTNVSANSTMVGVPAKKLL